MSIDELALAQCDAEPIHIPGVIQGHGALVAVDQTTLDITHASANIGDFLGVEPNALLGRAAQAVFGQDAAHTLRNILQVPNADQIRHPIGLVTEQGHALELSGFVSGTAIVIEMEHAQEPDWSAADFSARIAALFRSVDEQESVEGLLKSSVRWLEVLTGYDRVMIYRFKEDWSGEVVAERNMTEHEDFLGLSFPQWDIPRQAREIMLKLPMRLIADATAEPQPILAASDDLPPLDISLAHVRGVSPIHLQYLHNMKVAASMTLSIVAEGALWGIISFHHYQPKIPSPRTRAIAQPFIQYFNVKLAQLEQAEATATREQARDILDRIRRAHGDGADLDTLIAGHPMPLLEMFNAQGMAVRLNEQWQAFGKTVPAAAVQAIAQQAKEKKGVVSTDRISDLGSHEVWRFEGIAGVLAISLGGEDVAVVFREEIEGKVKWAGSPNKEISKEEGVYRLSPRGSFDLYVETVGGRSEPWRSIDIELAEGLAALFLQSEQQRQRIERKFFEDRDRQQKLMINELNHRVRNILALIRSVSRQARRANASLTSYSAALEHRIKALAIAHDLSNDASLASVDIAGLIQTELAPYAENGERRFTLTGDPFAIRPDLCPILALVVHELTTNAAKYGALSSSEGRIDVAMSPEDQGLKIRWHERGGPPVTAPTELGFGSLLIENAIPFELDGRVSIDCNPDGLVAEIWLPDAVLSAKQEKPKAYVTPFPKKQAVWRKAGQDLGTVLLVEDNYVIALDTEITLEKMGFSKVLIASNVERAMALVRRNQPAIGILDMHLGSETSFVVARELIRRNVPIIFATGYGSDIGRPPGLDHLPLITKPVDAEALVAEVYNALFAADTARPA